MSKKDIIKESESYAEKNGFKIKPNREIVDLIASGIAGNENAFGKRFCSCRAFTGDGKEDSICPCKWHKQEIESKGRCHCGLFVKA